MTKIQLKVCEIELIQAIVWKCIRFNFFFFCLELYLRKPSSLNEIKRKQTTAVVLLGVIGAEFGQDVGERRGPEQRRKSSIIDGFGIGNNNLARLTSMNYY